MPLHVIEALSLPGHTAKANEDAFGSAPAAVWVIDGATGLSKKSLTQTASDAAWFATHISTQLGHALATPTSLVKAAATAMHNTGTALQNLCGTLPESMVEMPCASGIIAQQNGDDIDVAFYGDCHLLAVKPDGSLLHFGGDPVHEQVDAHNIGEMARTRAEGESLADARARVIPLIAAGRARANAVDGYPLWSPLPEGAQAHAERLHQGRFTAPKGTIILLMSDGFYRLVDVLQEMDAAHLLLAAQTHGLASLANHLRHLETLDADARAYPRFKAHDDATALLAKVV